MTHLSGDCPLLKVSVKSGVAHTDFPAMFFVIIAFFLGATRPKPFAWGKHAKLFFVAFFVTLAMMTKVQVAPFSAALPLLLLLFILPEDRPNNRPVSVSDPISTYIFAISLLAFSVPAQSMIWSPIFWNVNKTSAIGGWYQIVLVAIVLGFLTFYSKYMRFRVEQYLLLVALVCGGVSIATYFNYFHHDVRNTYIVSNFFEHMVAFATQVDNVAIDKNNAQSSIGWLIHKLSNSMTDAVVRNFDLSSIVQRPLVILYWFVSVGSVLAWKYLPGRTAMICSVLIGLSFAMEAFTGLRYWSYGYGIFTEFWIFIAAGILIAAALKPDRIPTYFGRLGAKKLLMGSAIVALTLTRYFPDGIRIGANHRQVPPPMEGNSLCGHPTVPIL